MAAQRLADPPQQDLLEEVYDPLVIRLSEPEHRRTTGLCLLPAPSDLNQDRNPLVGRSPGQREDGRVADVLILVLVQGHLRQAFGGRIRGLVPEPEQGVLADPLAQSPVLGHVEEVAPDVVYIREHGRQYGFLGSACGSSVVRE